MSPLALPRWLGPVALALLLLAGIVTLKLAGNKIDDLKATVAAQETTIGSQRTLLADRDALIASQNAGIEALAQAASADREVYIRQYEAASTHATRHDDRAAQIMALPNDQLDELAQCRASRILLEEELTQ